MDYLFNEMKKFSEPLIIFLCGTKYNKNKEDKRQILKKFLKKHKNNKVIILEEHFIFGKTTKKYLSYNDIYMKNLQDVEMLTACFAKKIFIIHESMSTGAELATFASNEFLYDKLCVLVPDSTGVEEKKISTFLKLAYFKKEPKVHQITFYPEIYPYQISKQHIEIRTNFNNNSITKNLSSKINKFINLKSSDDIKYIRFLKILYNKPSIDPGIISYGKSLIDEKNAIAYVSARVVLYQIAALFSDKDFRKEVRKDKKLQDHVTYILFFYKEVMRNTISELMFNQFNDITITIIEINIKIRNVIAYALYILQALNAINLLQSEEEMVKFEISYNFDEQIGKYNALISKKIKKFGVVKDEC